MADKLLISAEVRTEFGKGASRRVRRENNIPAVVYGHGEDPRHLILPGHETSLAVRNANALITLDIEGEEQTVVPKDIQRDPITFLVEHMDLLAVRKGEKIIIDAPVEVIGEPADGYEYLLEQTTVAVEADALNLPEFIEIDIAGRDENALPEHLILPENVELALADLESPVVSIYEPQEQEIDTAEDETAEGEAAEESGDDE